MPAESEVLPTISVVTPSFQQGEFLEATLRSVLEQEYPHLEHIVVDGGSTDGSVNLLERYRRIFPGRLSYVSGPDRGQAHAVNKGLALAGGEVLGWLNSDDLYAGESLLAVGRYFARHPECDLLYGRADYIGRDGSFLAPYPAKAPFDWQALAHECYLCQPAVFWRRRCRCVLDESLDTCMDYELWIRVGRAARVHFLDRQLASSRLYFDNKTLARRGELLDDVVRTVKRHYRFLPLSWALGKAHYQVEGDAPIFCRVAPGWRSYLLAAVLLAVHNALRPQSWLRVGREVGAALRRKRGSVRASKSCRHAVSGVAPRQARAVWLQFEVTALPAVGRSEVSVWQSRRRLAHFAVDRTGPHRRVVGLMGSRGRPTLRVHSELIGDGMLRDVSFVPYPLPVGERWLTRRDRLLLPANWARVELTFVLAAALKPGGAVGWRWKGETLAQWHGLDVGRHARALDLPFEAGREDGLVELALVGEPQPPELEERGLVRLLAAEPLA